MSEPVNLNKFRKAKAKAEKEQKAKENRARFGRTKVAESSWTRPAPTSFRSSPKAIA
jgi:hypothetical protein